MRSSRLGLVGRLVVALLAVFALGAVVASAAWAEEAPHWTIEGTALKKNETREIKAEAVNGGLTLGIAALGTNIHCNKAKVATGAVLAGGEPGTSNSVSEFEECTQTGNGSPTACEVKEGKIVTNPIRAELVMNTELTSYLIEFVPASGEEFVTIKFKGTCTLKEAIVKGLVLASVYTDPTTDGGKNEPAGPSTPENTSFLLRFPDEPASKEVWLWKENSKGEILHEVFKPATLLTSVAGDAATLTGEILISLTSGKKYGARG